MLVDMLVVVAGLIAALSESKPLRIAGLIALAIGILGGVGDSLKGHFFF